MVSAACLARGSSHQSRGRSREGAAPRQEPGNELRCRRQAARRAEDERRADGVAALGGALKEMEAAGLGTEKRSRSLLSESRADSAGVVGLGESARGGGCGRSEED